MPKRTSVVERGKLLSLDPQENPISRTPESKRPRKQETKKPSLVKANLLVQRERWAKLKRYAVDHEKKYYEVLDEALARFLEPQAGR
jgi:hypothetical protein